MVGRKPGRLLAPVALVAVLVAIVLVVRAGVASHHTPAPPRPRVLPASRPAPPKRRFYLIRPGDSLSSISVKTHVPVATLEALNPGLDPNALQTGQRIRLR